MFNKCCVFIIIFFSWVYSLFYVFVLVGEFSRRVSFGGGLGGDIVRIGFILGVGISVFRWILFCRDISFKGKSFRLGFSFFYFFVRFRL